MEALISIGDLFKKSRDFYKKNAKIILMVCGIGYAPVLILYVMGFSFGMDFNGYSSLAPPRVLLFSILSLIIFAVNFWVYVSLFYIIKGDGEGSALTLKSVFFMARGKEFSLAWIILLETVCIFFGLILLIIPGVIFAVWFIFANQVFVFEGIKGKGALARSKELVKGYWWPIFGRFLLFFIISAIITAIPFFGDLLNGFVIVPLCVIYFYFIYTD